MVQKRNSSLKNIVFWVAAGAVIIFLWSVLQTPAMIKTEVTFSQFMIDVEGKKVEEVTITGAQLRGQYRDGTTFKTVLPPQYDDLIKILRQSGVAIVVKDAGKAPWYSYLLSWFPFVMLIVFWVMFMRQQGGNKAFTFGKSRARLFTPRPQQGHLQGRGRGRGGQGGARRDHRDSSRSPRSSRSLGGKIPKGVLLVGAPGHRQDPAGQGHRRRSQRALLLHLRLGLRRDVRRRRRLARPRPVRRTARSTPPA